MNVFLEVAGLPQIVGLSGLWGSPGDKQLRGRKKVAAEAGLVTSTSL
jgi:hypothetical protein